MPEPLLELRDLSLACRGRIVLSGISLRLAPGECLGLVGPNGAGKSTLIRAALGVDAAQGFNSLTRLPPGPRALKAAWLPQGREVAWPMPVRDLVALGRLPHLARGTALPPGDARIVEGVLKRLGLEGFAERSVMELSGGELARVLLARALAQETPLILADEPAAGLDPAYQMEVMGLLADLAAQGRGVLVTCHDLGLAARFCSRIAVIEAGRIVADGPPAEVLTPELLERVFRISARIERTPEGLFIQPHAVRGRLPGGLAPDGAEKRASFA
ncbi:ABC transporter ATP-binding protein [Neomegalonema sp.]|uniref:ABC transporter ATP-binding protein n=1 Tax=Neomegalonema sp. TaxID=2039713 RepID=UPI00260CA3AD|nr:ABC transporter ATP-binding protein [Neomegalonema sp.]MDD2867802.1 ABC transporter ATP-binding protein [Neomegalonema sp.]